MSKILQLTSVARHFAGLVAVDKVTTQVDAGEIRGLIGPNGAGKTTLLNLIGGQLTLSSGRIWFNGADVTDLRSYRRAVLGVSRTFQNLKLFKDMNVLQNVMVGLHATTKSEAIEALLHTPRQRREEARMAEESYEALRLVGLKDHAYKTAASLAYGHRRLLEVARAVVAKPRLLLLDEPAAGLNGAELVELVDLIRKICASGVTIILVEHHMDVVMSACHKISVLNYGRLLAEGSPDEIREHEDVIEAYFGRGTLEFGDA